MKMCYDDGTDSDRSSIADSNEVRVGRLDNCIITNPSIRSNLDTSPAMQPNAQGLRTRRVASK
jgi:hypothetical protein